MALAMTAFGGLAAVAAAPAFADVTTANYTIGTPTGAVTGATVSPTTATNGVGQSFTVSFVTPASLSPGATITIGDSAGNSVVGSANPLNFYLLSGTCLQTTGATASTTSGFVITLSSVSCPSGISAGGTVSVTFSATATANFNFTVATSANATAASTPTVTVASAPPTLAISNYYPGVSATYSITGVNGSHATGGNWPSTASVSMLQLTATAVTWGGAGEYSLSAVSSSGTVTENVNNVLTGTATGASGPYNYVDLWVSPAISSAQSVNITSVSMNPSSGGSSVVVNVLPFNGSFDATTSTWMQGTSQGPTESTGSISIGAPVVGPQLSVSPLVANQSATYTVTFVAASKAAGGGITTGSSSTASAGTINLSESSGPTNFGTVTGVLVSDATSNWSFVSTATKAGTGPQFSGSSGGLTIYLPANDSINPGDAVTVQVIGVTNPGNGTYSDFDVSTTGDPASTPVPTYSISPTGVAAPTVIVNPNTTGAVATYTISGLYATSNITGGSTSNEIVLSAPSGTVFPNNASYYTVTDATTSSGSGTFALVGYTGNTVTLVPPNNITNGDALSITIEDTVNPSTASADYNIAISGDVGESSTAAFPDANVTYSNGAIVDFSGTMYVFAGGHAFGVPTPKILNAVKAVDPATVVKAGTGAKVPTASVRSGTLITTNAVNGTPTIYVMGTDGDLHGFSTPAQLLSDGYNAALNVTVPNLAGLTVGTTVGQAGSAVTALATASDGALINSSGTIYVLAGGRAFGIPGPKALSAIRLTDKATVQTGTVSTTLTSQSLANGVLVTANKVVYVTYNGYLWPFKAMKQLMADGYGGTASVPVVFTSTNKPGIVTGYAGY